MNIFIYINTNEYEKGFLKENLHTENLLFAGDLPKKDQLPAFLESEVVFGNVSAEWLPRSQVLKWLQLESVGFDLYRNLNWDTLGKQIKVTNLKGMFGIPVGETAIAGILALFRGIDKLMSLKVEKRWKGATLRPVLKTLNGAKVIILGDGSIGQTLRNQLQGFGCNVKILGKFSREADFYTLEELDKVLPDTDIVICCLPETEETIGLFNSSRLGLLPNTAVFVNIGRGSVVIEEALVEAIQKQKLSGCVLDVSNDEPIPDYHPLWKCLNTILTQHTGGGSGDEIIKKIEIFLANVKRYRNNEDMNNLVDFKRGY